MRCKETGVHLDDDEMPEVERAHPGRKKVEIDLKQFENACQLLLTQEEMAILFGVSRRTIIRRMQENADFKLAFAAGRVKNKVNLMTLLFRHAKMPNSAGVQAAIHLSKHMMGWKENAPAAPSVNITIDVIRKALGEIEEQPFELPDNRDQLPPPADQTTH
jgi:DNA-binding XRE family transcriptional regulator